MQTLPWIPKPITYRWAYCSKLCPAALLVGFEIGKCRFIFDEDWWEIPVSIEVDSDCEDRIKAIELIRLAENWRHDD